MLGSESLQAVSETEMDEEAVRVKLNLQRRPEEIRDVKNLGHQPRKAAGYRKSQTKRENMWDTISKGIGAGFPRDNISPLYALDSGHGATELNIYPAKIWVLL